MTALRAVPEPREPGRYRIAVVCLGNICRSPMADVVLSARIDDAGLAGCVEVVSAGTGDWHIGGTMDSRAAGTLLGEGYDPTRHRAQQVGRDWFATIDLMLAMDQSNLRDLRNLAPAGLETDRLRLFRDYDPAGRGEVPDPYYGGQDGFIDVLAMVERTSASLVAALQRRAEFVPPH